MLRRASCGLLERLQQERLRGHRPESIGNVDLDIYAAHALALLDAQDSQQDKQGLDDLRAAVARFEDESRWPRLLDQALLADTRLLLGNRARASAALERLTGQSLPMRGDRGSIFAAAAILELGMALKPGDARWPPLARQLAAVRSGGGWGDTLTSSAAVRSLAAALAAPQAVESPVAVRIDGRRVGDLTSARGNRIEWKLPRIGAVTLHPANLPCEDFYQVRVEGLVAARGAATAAPAATIRTRLFHVQPSRQELNSDASGRLSLVHGRTYEMQIEVELKQPASYARLTLPRPCGMELVHAPTRVNGLAAIEARDDAVHFFIDHWEAGRRQIVLPIRAEVAGAVAVPPPELSPMYGDSLPTATAGSREWRVKE